jgi:hypothetical protein
MEEKKVYENVSFGGAQNIGTQYESKFKVAGNANLPAKPSFFTKLKNVLFYEIKVELTPYQQKIEDEINEFLYQEVTWQKVHDFLFQEITFGRKNKAKTVEISIEE